MMPGQYPAEADVPQTPILPDHAHVGYELEAIPRRFRNAQCAEFYVEFFENMTEPPPPGRSRWSFTDLHFRSPRASQQNPNSAQIKIDFVEEVNERFRGVSIEIVANPGAADERTDLEFSKHTPGRIIVRPVQYREACRRATGTFRLARMGEYPRSLNDIIRSITDAGLHHFDFNKEGDSMLRGSRDFVYQVLMHLRGRQYVDDLITEIWPIELRQNNWQALPDVMGKRFSDGKFNEHPIRRGRFRIYQRRTPNPPQYEP
ncbi:hypothetical protein F4806DRAFT_493039 [Annulohypoxylon nitens]|nr:hypothetical protein F4806DRAFT_493039 [Annulohypoxylon nitens]